MDRTWKALRMLLLWVVVFGPFIIGMAIVFHMIHPAIDAAVKAPDVGMMLGF